MTVAYDSRFIPAHGCHLGPTVLLMNEAPGPSEANAGIPSFGQQGANIFNALRNAGISWALSHNHFSWPIKPNTVQTDRHRRKEEFLADRALHITSTNAYPFWPQPNPESSGFCTPEKVAVLSNWNRSRIRSEVLSTHRAIMICGSSAYLACVGRNLQYPSAREFTLLSITELQDLNRRLSSQFELGWYMGHTRRWSLRASETKSTLRDISRFLGWSLMEDLCAPRKSCNQRL